MKVDPRLGGQWKVKEKVPHAWWPMEGEGEGSRAWWPMEGEGEGSPCLVANGR